MAKRRKPKVPKKRSASAAALAGPLFRKRVVPDRKKEEARSVTRKVIRDDPADDNIND